MLDGCARSRCPLHLLLLPLSGVFVLLRGLRRLAYRLGLLKTVRLPVPVVVVGNITVGGSGKTPLVIWLAGMLREAGWHPGVISRGYGGSAHGPCAVGPDSDPRLVGDEPLLIARAGGVPVSVGRRRADAGRALLADDPRVEVLLSDDGLQHYALARDVEIAVVDGARRFGNGWPLPAGPLREPLSRLREVDAVVINGGEREAAAEGVPQFAMALRPGLFRRLGEPGVTRAAADFRGREVHAVAGIGDPQRFFDTLDTLGIRATPHPFPDHHAYARADLPTGTIIMTGKDAAKCEGFALRDAWVLEVDAILSPGLKELILTKLKECHGRQAA